MLVDSVKKGCPTDDPHMGILEDAGFVGIIGHNDMTAIVKELAMRDSGEMLSDCAPRWRCFAWKSIHCWATRNGHSGRITPLAWWFHPEQRRLDWGSKPRRRALTMSGEEIENWITTKDEAEQGYDLEEGSSAFAFKLRVMLSRHVWLKYAAFKKLQDEGARHLV